MEKRHAYITTTLPYVNAEPHIGFAMEFIRADVTARILKEQGYEVFFNTGTEEHGLKLWNDAQKAGIEVQEYVDGYAEKFRSLIPLLGIDEQVHFIRTTDPHHEKAAQAFWLLCKERGFIYKKKYQIKYCVGCELEKTDSELDHGACPLHPNREIELIDEENYFFKFSQCQQVLQELYVSHPDFVVPSSRLNEISSFVSRGLEDFSISRLASKMPWGIPVPDDADHVMYVWFDALVNYISTLGWPENKDTFTSYWKEGSPIQYCGKDNLRQQAAMWQGMLYAAGLPFSRHIVVNGFVTADGGMKMSKSLGNVIAPSQVVEKYGRDALRYFLLREVMPFEDSPVTWERFDEAYHAHLANGLGNCVSRVLKMAVSYDAFPEGDREVRDITYPRFDYKKALDEVWTRIGECDARIQSEEPYKVFKTDPERARKEVRELVSRIYEIGKNIQPFLPDTSEKIISSIIHKTTLEQSLFPRIES